MKKRVQKSYDGFEKLCGKKGMVSSIKTQGERGFKKYHHMRFCVTRQNRRRLIFEHLFFFREYYFRLSLDAKKSDAVVLFVHRITTQKKVDAKMFVRRSRSSARAKKRLSSAVHSFKRERRAIVGNIWGL